MAHTPITDDHIYLKNGDGVFVSVSQVCEFSPFLVIQSLNLVPFFYKGLGELAPGAASSIHVEAESDLQQCRAIVLVLPLSSRGKIGIATWGYKQLDLLTRTGMK